MGRITIAVVVGFVLSAGPAIAGSLEDARGAATSEFDSTIAEGFVLKTALEQLPSHGVGEGAPDPVSEAPPVEGEPAMEPAAEPNEMPPMPPILRDPSMAPALPESVGPLLGSFVLAERLDTHRDLMNRRFGALQWDTSIAGDSEFKVVYLTFSRPGVLLLRKIEDPKRLRGEGVVVQIDAQTFYRFKLSINIFDPIRGSTLRATPENGAAGPSHAIKTGEILDRTKAKSYVFQASGNEYWLLYGTDVDTKTDQLADTRSLLFIHFDGLDSKAWPVGESKLETGKPLAVSLDGTAITLVKSDDGKLYIHQGSGSAILASR